MRKISLALTLIGLATVFCACGDDGNKSYCDSGFTDGCENGKYVYCEFEGSSSNGKIVTKATVEFNNVEYVCNENNELVPKDYVCENGILLHDVSRLRIMPSAMTMKHFRSATAMIWCRDIRHVSTTRSWHV